MREFKVTAALAEPVGGHPQTHHTHNAADSRRRLSLVLVLTAAYMLAEAVGGWWTGSLALLADAGHMLTDVAALTLALIAVWFAARPATSSKTFGYYRLEILAALINGVALILISGLIIYEASQRWLAPPPIRGRVVMFVALGGLIINLVCAWILHGRHEIDLNIRGVWLHVLGDALGSLAAIAAGAAITWYQWYFADPLFSVVIGLLIIWSSWTLIRESDQRAARRHAGAHQPGGRRRSHSRNGWCRQCARLTRLDDNLRP